MTKQDKQTMNKTEELKEMVTDKLRDLHYAGLEPLELKYIDGIVDIIKQSNREAIEKFVKYLGTEATIQRGVGEFTLTDTGEVIDIKNIYLKGLDFSGVLNKYLQESQ